MGAVLQMRRQPGNKPRAERAFLRMFPVQHHEGRRYMYALELPDGRVKIGLARRPRERIGQYLSLYGGLAWAHLFPPIRRAHDVERASIARLEAVSGVLRQGKSEFFRHASKADAIAAVRAAMQDVAA